MPTEDDRKAPLQDLGAKDLDAKAAEEVKGGHTDFVFVHKYDKSSPVIGSTPPTKP